MADSGGTCTPSSPKLKENAETEQASASKATEEDPELEELLDSKQGKVLNSQLAVK